MSCSITGSLNRNPSLEFPEINTERNNNMVQLLAPIERKHPNLILHCGAHRVDRQEVENIPTPRSTETWTPIPHMELILGLRNSHDKTFPAGITAGAQVFVCDNLSFSGEVKLARKHTRFIVRDLPQLVGRAIGKLMEKWHDQDRRISVYKEKRIADVTAHDLIIRSCDVGVCSNRLIPAVLSEWRQPRYKEFGKRNIWSLFNAFTESLKTGNLAELPKRTEALHGLLDNHVGLNL